MLKGSGSFSEPHICGLPDRIVYNLRCELPGCKVPVEIQVSLRQKLLAGRKNIRVDYKSFVHLQNLAQPNILISDNSRFFISFLRMA